MKIADALATVRRVFLDTAPVIYHVEGAAAYQPLTDVVFLGLTTGTLEAVCTPVTLVECLVHPLRKGDQVLAARFRSLLKSGVNTRYVGVDAAAETAADLRARYHLSLPDAFQVAAAVASGCDAFLTNDFTLKRVSELTILVLDELEV